MKLVLLLPQLLEDTFYWI